MNKRKTNNLIKYLLVIWATFAAYFAISDLPISISVVNQNSGWADFLRAYGELPGVIVLYAGALIFLASYKTVNKLKFFAYFTFIFLAAVYLLKRASTIVYLGLTDNTAFVINNKFYIYLFFFVVNIFIYILFKKKRYSKELKLYSMVSILLGLYGYLLFVQPIKHLWGRVRFRDLDALYSNFTPWFLPNGINGNQSFPSGHAAMAWMILPLLLLVVNNNKNIKIFLLILIIFWGLAVQCSRVVIGAHYASDVLFGGIIIIIIFLSLCKKFVPDNSA